MKIILSLVTACLVLLVSLSTCTASLAQFAGDWSNVDPNTGGITKLSIAISGASANVHAWGKCHPTDCDWGSVNAFAFAPDVSSDPVSQAQAMMAIFDEVSKRLLSSSVLRVAGYLCSHTLASRITAAEATMHSVVSSRRVLP